MTLPTYEDLCAAIASTGVPYYRVSFDPYAEDKPSLPFVCLVPGNTSDVHAGGTNYVKATDYTVELYERGSSRALETSFEEALEAAGFTYYRSCIPMVDGVEEEDAPRNGAVEMAYEVTVLGR